MHKEFRVPDHAFPWNAETWATTAEVEVLRSYSNSGGNTLAKDTKIHVLFFAYGSSPFTSINGSPPPLIYLRSGDVVVLPLRSNPKPYFKPWTLLGVDSSGLLMPARAGLAKGAFRPATGRNFIVRELANSLSHGTAEQASRAGAYVHDQPESQVPDLMPLLEQYIGLDEQRWLRCW